MKKIFTAAICIVLMTLAITSASAAGKMTVTDESFYVFDSWGSWYGYVYAKIENVGDKPVEFSDGLLELYNVAGDSIGSTSIYDSFPTILQPGEVGFISAYQEAAGAQSAADVNDHLLTIIGKGYSGEPCTPFTVTNPYYQAAPADSWEYDYIYATIENVSDKIQYGYEIVFALYDAGGHLIYVGSLDSYYSDNYGMYPGAKQEVRVYVDSNIATYIKDNGVVLGQVEVYAYVYPEY